jgi:hypothetical protein
MILAKRKSLSETCIFGKTHKLSFLMLGHVHLLGKLSCDFAKQVRSVDFWVDVSIECR